MISQLSEVGFRQLPVRPSWDAKGEFEITRLYKDLLHGLALVVDLAAVSPVGSMFNVWIDKLPLGHVQEYDARGGGFLRKMVLGPPDAQFILDALQAANH